MEYYVIDGLLKRQDAKIFIAADNRSQAHAIASYACIGGTNTKIRSRILDNKRVAVWPLPEPHDAKVPCAYVVFPNTLKIVCVVKQIEGVLLKQD